ncbi:hypothetical protein NDU88_000131 [Pleurodeles waltl]|uniref:Uncharacterized protein n=1 Tax=Pleurodeles waltl TaxID=8319 RepID=A0AAV7KPH7_PLEWA|nr:hypothetical protein NDU88_000131 [Pleurodeles waltl]
MQESQVEHDALVILFCDEEVQGAIADHAQRLCAPGQIGPLSDVSHAAALLLEPTAHRPEVQVCKHAFMSIAPGEDQFLAHHDAILPLAPGVRAGMDLPRDVNVGFADGRDH